jgi:hypothetical protein
MFYAPAQSLDMSPYVSLWKGWDDLPINPRDQKADGYRREAPIAVGLTRHNLRKNEKNVIEWRRVSLGNSVNVQK